MATPQNSQVLSAHMARIMFKSGPNGAAMEVGYIQNLTYSINFGLQEVFAIGSVKTLEHQQTRYQVSGEASQYFLRKKIIDAQPGDPFGARTVEEVLQNGTFDVVILDDVSKKPIRTLENCTLGSENSGVTAGQLMVRRFSFQALTTR